MSKIKELISELKHILEWSQPISRYNEILGIVNAIEIELEPKVVKVVEDPREVARQKWANWIKERNKEAKE